MLFLRRTPNVFLLRKKLSVYTVFSRAIAGALLGSILLASCDSDSGTGSTPDTPVLMAPLNASADRPNALYLEWTGSSDTESFHLQVSMRSDFNTLIVERPNMVDTITPVNELILGSTYFWRVRAKSDAGQSDWSVIWSFTPSTVAERPPVTVLAFPPHGAVDQGTTVTFRWTRTERAKFYHIQASLEEDFFSREADMIVDSDTSQSVSALVKEYTYFWRVRGENAVGFGPWSPTRFVVIGDFE